MRLWHNAQLGALLRTGARLHMISVARYDATLRRLEDIERRVAQREEESGEDMRLSSKFASSGYFSASFRRNMSGQQ